MTTDTTTADTTETIFALSADALAKADAIVARYPEKRSATLPLLHLAQEERGFIDDALIQWVAAKTDVPAVDVLGVVTFYPMFRQKPIGRRHIRVCRTLSCALRGAQETMAAFEKEFGINRGETAPDGSVTLEFVECIAACGSGPVVHVDHALHENITPKKVPALVAAIRASLADADYGKRQPKPNSPEWQG
jgi:NADH-quinone oxidoreductase subunit E